MVDQRQQITATRADLARAMREGADAAADPAAEATACPYKPGGDANDRVKAQAWLRGFLTARGVIGPHAGEQPPS